MTRDIKWSWRNINTLIRLCSQTTIKICQQKIAKKAYLECETKLKRRPVNSRHRVYFTHACCCLFFGRTWIHCANQTACNFRMPNTNIHEFHEYTWFLVKNFHIFLNSFIFQQFKLICDRQVNSNIRHDQRSNSQSNKDFFFSPFYDLIFNK